MVNASSPKPETRIRLVLTQLLVLVDTPQIRRRLLSTLLMLTATQLDLVDARRRVDGAFLLFDLGAPAGETAEAAIRDDVLHSSSPIASRWVL
jgi:hypothetical protein